MLSKVSIPVAGRISHALQFWQTLTEDFSILQTVKGLKLDFIDGEKPFQQKIPFQKIVNQAETSAIETEISRLIQKGVLIPSQEEKGQYVNTIFTRPKKDGSHRMILNLKPLNQFVEYKKFKMDTIRTVLQLMHKNCYMASIDIADAYYTVPIHANYQKFLKFRWGGNLYQYTALPNGYSDAPRVFTKLLKPVFAQLRRLGHTVVGYIDDIYIQSDTEQGCVAAISDAMNILQNCGFLIHEHKSCLTPKTNATYLGFDLDSTTMTIKVTPEKKLKYVASCTSLLQSDTCSLRTLAKVIGQLISTFPGVRYGPLHYRQTEKVKIQGLKHHDDNFEAIINLPHSVKEELSWWIENLGSAENYIHTGHMDVELMSDSTLDNWGAKLGNMSTGGAFSAEEKAWAGNNINACEMLAVFLALQTFIQELRGKKVLIRSDNMTAVTYIAKMGGIRSVKCNKLAVQIWHWCIENDIWLSAEHIAGVLNIDADYESRHVDERLEWALYPEIFQKLCQRFGTPEIDLFATRLNKKLDKFVSWRPEPGAFIVNAFTMNWQGLYSYMFPPFSLITRCLQKVQLECTDTLLIAPLWPTQPWFAQLMSLLIEIPVLLPKRNLYLPSDPEKQHPLQHLRLLACRLSGDQTKLLEFRTELFQSYQDHGDTARKSSTVLSFRSGRDILLHGLLVTIPLL